MSLRDDPPASPPQYAHRGEQVHARESLSIPRLRKKVSKMKSNFGSCPLVVLTLVASVSLVGCGGGDKTAAQQTKGPEVVAPAEVPVAATDEVATERAKLSPEDKAIVDAQEWCVISNEERLGSMGAPIKLDIKGQAVFICCKGCQKKAESDPDATLAKVEELKAKKKAQSGEAQPETKTEATEPAPTKEGEKS